MRNKLYLTLLSLSLALVALPAAASAQTDNLADAPVLANPLPPSPRVLGFNGDTTNFTLEGGEFNQCGNSIYGKTMWSLFAVDRTGRIDVTTAGFDSVIAINSVNRDGSLAGGPCSDRLSGTIESFSRDSLPTVKKGGVYALQVGGFQGPDGSIAGGRVDVNVELLSPQQVQGDAILTWRSARGGVKVTSIKVSGPRGSGALITCLRKKCGKDQVIRNPKLKGVFAKPIAKEAPSSAKSAGGKTKPKPVDRSQVTLAATSGFKGRTVKNGSRLLVVVLGEDQIGQAFFWDVKKNLAGAKSLGCVEPGGDTIQKPGTCDGV